MWKVRKVPEEEQERTADKQGLFLIYLLRQGPSV